MKLPTTEYRSQMMSKIRSTGGKAETLLAKMLWHSGVRYRRNYRVLPGKPDIAITKYRIAVFIDGEFWHGYDWENQKKRRIHRNRAYWIQKIEGNMARDERERGTNPDGWRVMRFWEKHDVWEDPDVVLRQITDAIRQSEHSCHH